MKKAASPLEPKTPHFAPKAKSVIFLFMEGGPSHIDLFDPKPKLNEMAGKPLPDSFAKVITAMGEFHSPLLAAPRTWKQHGQSGLWMSEWVPHIAECADDLAVIRSLLGGRHQSFLGHLPDEHGLDSGGSVLRSERGSHMALARKTRISRRSS